MGDKVKLNFTLDFQFDILRFCALDRDGRKVIDLLEDSYFSVVEHAFIFYGIKQFFKANKRVPGKVALRQELSELFRSKEYYDKISVKDENKILTMVEDIFQGVLKDGDIIFKKIEKFIQYVQLKDVVENVDILNFDEYDTFANKVHKAISKRLNDRKDKGSFLIRDIRDRQLYRQEVNPIIPTPFRQVNALTNAGGYSRNSLIVILDKPKKFKTGCLVNVAVGYMKMKKRIILFDLDNSADEYMIRIEQRTSGSTKREVLSGELDTKIQKIVRKYKRLGAELVIHRLPAYSTTTKDLQRIIKEHYKEDGIRFEIMILDYIGLLGTTDKREDDTSRIDRAFVEIRNLALEEDMEHVWTAHHVVRGAEKREKTRYLGTDIAKSIDITRHVQAIWGLNRTIDEEEQGFLRMEIVDQRDGVPRGRAVFTVSQEKQTMVELTKGQREEYDKQFAIIENNIRESEEGEDNTPAPKKKAARSL